MKPPLLVRGFAPAQSRGWPVVSFDAAEISVALGADTRLVINTAARGGPVARLSFRLPEAAGRSVDALASELLGRIGDAALAMVPQEQGAEARP